MSTLGRHCPREKGPAVRCCTVFKPEQRCITAIELCLLGKEVGVRVNFAGASQPNKFTAPFNASRYSVVGVKSQGFVSMDSYPESAVKKRRRHEIA